MDRITEIDMSMMFSKEQQALENVRFQLQEQHIQIEKIHDYLKTAPAGPHLNRLMLDLNKLIQDTETIERLLK